MGFSEALRIYTDQIDVYRRRKHSNLPVNCIDYAWTKFQRTGAFIVTQTKMSKWSKLTKQWLPLKYCGVFLHWISMPLLVLSWYVRFLNLPCIMHVPNHGPRFVYASTQRFYALATLWSMARLAWNEFIEREGSLVIFHINTNCCTISDDPLRWCFSSVLMKVGLPVFLLGWLLRFKKWPHTMHSNNSGSIATEYVPMWKKIELYIPPPIFDGQVVLVSEEE